MAIWLNKFNGKTKIIKIINTYSVRFLKIAYFVISLLLLEELQNGTDQILTQY